MNILQFRYEMMQNARMRRFFNFNEQLSDAFSVNMKYINIMFDI